MVKMIDKETRQIIEEFMDEMGVPCVDYEKAFNQIIREAVAFSLKGCREAFLKQLEKWSEKIS